MTRKLVAKRSTSMTYDIALATDSHGHEDDLQCEWVYLIRQGREESMRINNSFHTHQIQKLKNFFGTLARMHQEWL